MKDLFQIDYAEMEKCVTALCSSCPFCPDFITAMKVKYNKEHEILLCKRRKQDCGWKEVSNGSRKEQRKTEKI